MRIVADQNTCEGHGMCEAMADQYFELDDDFVVTVLKPEPDSGDEELVDAAVQACPVAALRLEK